MLFINGWRDFNESKVKIVKSSDLDDTWSANYHISDEIEDIKKEYKKIGRDKIIDKIISISKKIGKKDYNEAKKHAKLNFNQNLPTYETAIKRDYWVGHWAQISTIIITLSSLETSISKSKDVIKKEIDKLQKRLDTLNKLNESSHDDYSDFLQEVMNAAVLWSSEMTEDKAWDFVQYYHDKG